MSKQRYIVLGETSNWEWAWREIPFSVGKVGCSRFCKVGHAHIPEALNFVRSFQNQEMLTEGDLANSMDQTDKVRELQDKIARLRAQVSQVFSLNHP